MTNIMKKILLGILLIPSLINSQNLFEINTNVATFNKDLKTSFYNIYDNSVYKCDVLLAPQTDCEHILYTECDDHHYFDPDSIRNCQATFIKIKEQKELSEWINGKMFSISEQNYDGSITYIKTIKIVNNTTSFATVYKNGKDHENFTLYGQEAQLIIHLKINNDYLAFGFIDLTGDDNIEYIFLPSTKLELINAKYNKKLGLDAHQTFDIEKDIAYELMVSE